MGKAIRSAIKPKKVTKRFVRKSKRVTRKMRKMQSGSKIQVWNGTKICTKGGLLKKDLCINKRGKVVSKKQMASGKKALGGWVKAIAKARKQLGITGFAECRKGTKYYKLVKKLYGK